MDSLFPDPATSGQDQGSLIAQLLAGSLGIDPGSLPPQVPPPGVAPPIAPPPASAAPTFGQGGSPFQFPQSQAFGGNLPAPAAPAAAPTMAQAPANTSVDDDNDPIAVGNYQMPRIGSGFPDDTAPAPRPQQPAPAASANPLAPVQNFFNRTAAGLHSMSQGGSMYGAVTGNFDDPRNYAQQQLQKQVVALVNAGVPQKQAVLAVLNPEAAKAIIQQYVGADKNKFVQLKDALGAEHPAFVNAENQTINGQPIADYNKQNASNSNAGLGDTSKSGIEYLATLQPKERGVVQAMLDGRQAPPSSFALGKPYWQNMIAAANNVDPTFDQTSWPARVKGMTSFRSGADAGTVRSANQVLGHISDLTDKADALHNGDYPSFNYVKNIWNSQTGGDAANNWVTQAHAVADELSSFMKGAGHSSDTEIQQWKESLSPNMSPQQQRGATKTLMGIYDHALTALEDKRTGAIGPMAAEKLGPLVTPAGQAAMDKVRKWAAGSATGAAGAGGTTPTGVKWSVVQ